MYVDSNLDLNTLLFCRQGGVRVVSRCMGWGLENSSLKPLSIQSSVFLNRPHLQVGSTFELNITHAVPDTWILWIGHGQTHGMRRG